MRLAGTATIEQANRMLRDFLPRYNRRFGVAPAQPGSAYRQPARASPLMRSCASSTCAPWPTTIPSTLTAPHSRCCQMASGPAMPEPGVEVQVRLDGSILSSIRGRCVASAPAPLEPVILRAQKGPRYNGLLLADTPSFSDNGNHDTLTTTPFTPKKTRLQTTTKPSPNHPWRRPY